MIPALGRHSKTLSQTGWKTREKGRKRYNCAFKEYGLRGPKFSKLPKISETKHGGGAERSSSLRNNAAPQCPAFGLMDHDVHSLDNSADLEKRDSRIKTQTN